MTVNSNPFKDRLVVTVQSLYADNATLVLTDVSGRQIARENKSLFAGTNVLSINETDKLIKGTYLLTVIRFNQTQTIKVIKGN